MSRIALTGAAALTLALLASAPALAGCRSVMFTDVQGDYGINDTQAGRCAQWGVYGRGHRQAATGIVTGRGTNVVTGNLGYGSSTHVDSDGIEAQIATQMRSGAKARVFNRGTNDIIVRGANGSGSDVKVVGNGSYVRSEAW